MISQLFVFRSVVSYSI